MLLNNHPLLDLEHPLCSHLQVSEVCDLLVSAAQRWRWMSIEQKLCREKYFQIQSMPNITKCIDKRFAIKNLGISCLALTFNFSKNEDPAHKNWFKGGSSLLDITTHIPFFSTDPHELMVL